MSRAYRLTLYETAEGRVPYKLWFDALKDTKVQVTILARLDRLEYGHLGIHRAVGNGVYELKIHQGPGYRIYFGRDGHRLIILLCGGDKGSQKRDIHQAHILWKDYKERI